MPDYFEAPDAHGESCIWIPTDNGPWCLLCQSDVAGTDRWPDVVARMTGTTVVADDDTTAAQLKTAKVQLKTMSGVVDRLRADMRTWQRAASERVRELNEATDQLEAMTRACDAYRADRDELSELLAKANDGTTITTDDATVETVAKAITPHYFTPAFGEHAREQSREAARAVLAALTGVPHEV